eukprot:scaffold227707_cov39-Prasinocladus_malaysianus.AAC.1
MAQDNDRSVYAMPSCVCALYQAATAAIHDSLDNLKIYRALPDMHAIRARQENIVLCIAVDLNFTTIHSRSL